MARSDKKGRHLQRLYREKHQPDQEGAEQTVTGYAPSILQYGDACWLCGRNDRKLDRHEVFGAAYREKSKQDGLWVLLCHEECHEGPRGAQYDPVVRRYLSAYAQGMAMEHYGWTLEEWIQRYGKNWRD